jgi:hypothetical protein
MGKISDDFFLNRIYISLWQRLNWFFNSFNETVEKLGKLLFCHSASRQMADSPTGELDAESIEYQ